MLIYTPKQSLAEISISTAICAVHGLQARLISQPKSGEKKLSEKCGDCFGACFGVLEFVLGEKDAHFQVNPHIMELSSLLQDCDQNTMDGFMHYLFVLTPKS